MAPKLLKLSLELGQTKGRGSQRKKVHSHRSGAGLVRFLMAEGWNKDGKGEK